MKVSTGRIPVVWESEDSCCTRSLLTPANPISILSQSRLMTVDNIGVELTIKLLPLEIPKLNSN